MEINFIFQVNSFHRFKRENPLSANAQALWVELFGLFNARRFPEEMPVSTERIYARSSACPKIRCCARVKN